MKEYYVHLNGLWSFDFGDIKANSKEEARMKAIKIMDGESGSIELDHIEQFVEEEGGSGPGFEDMMIIGKYYFEILEASDKKRYQWYRASAEEGDAEAQDMLGYYYKENIGVPKDLVEAYKWFALAASRLKPGDRQKQAQKDRDLAEREITAEQAAKAHKLVREWKPQSVQ